MAFEADITELLNAARSGNPDAEETAYALVYDELKRCARRQKAFVPGSSLSPTALVSELYLRLSHHRGDPVRDRAHFFALAARAMRQIVVDHARRRASVKRGVRLPRHVRVLRKRPMGWIHAYPRWLVAIVTIATSQRGYA